MWAISPARARNRSSVAAGAASVNSASSSRGHPKTVAPDGRIETELIDMFTSWRQHRTRADGRPGPMGTVGAGRMLQPARRSLHAGRGGDGVEESSSKVEVLSAEECLRPLRSRSL